MYIEEIYADIVRKENTLKSDIDTIIKKLNEIEDLIIDALDDYDDICTEVDDQPEAFSDDYEVIKGEYAKELDKLAYIQYELDKLKRI